MMKRFLFFAISQLLVFTAVAKKTTNTETLEIGQFAEQAVLTVIDDRYTTMEANAGWQSDFENVSVKNYITLYIDHESKIYQPESYSVDITLNISYDVWSETDGAFITQTTTRTIEVNYNKDGTAYKDKSTIVLEGGHKLMVTITDVNGTAQIMNLALDASIELERYETFAVTNIPQVTHSDVHVASRGELDITWQEIAGAEEYDLEWTFVGNVSATGVTTDPSLITVDDQLFRVNSSRVTITKTSYSIPLIYEQGFIVYRVRGIGTHSSNRKLYQFGAWSTDGFTNCCSKVADFSSGTAINYYYFDGHQQAKNWQYVVNYAEEGKSKLGVSYYDGSLKNRQTVSKLKEEDETIASEVIYDFQGRPAVNVLPAPTGKKAIDFNPDFNVNTQGQPYSWEDFDKDASACDAGTSPLGQVDGAGKYYSPANTNGGNQDYIPDAKGYPLSRTEYTPDNTGRIRREGGVGSDHQLGSQHETKYFYGIPLQEELDRLFGSEVGDFSHYKKNMVQDANGQVSVSYQDMQGNTIATALAGDEPKDEQGRERLKALDNQDTRSIKSDLIRLDSKAAGDPNPQRLTSEKNAVVYNQEMLVSTSASRTFDYQVAQEQYKVNCTNNSQNVELCYDCVLELTFMVSDECGKHYLVDPTLSGEANLYSTVIGQDILDAIAAGNYTASTPTADLEVFKLSEMGWGNTTDLPVGKYTISKVLKVNQQALDFYTEQYLAQECLIPFNQFVAIEKSYMDTIGCNMSCDTCFARLGDYNQYDSNVNPTCDPCYTFEEYEVKYQQCQALCGLEDITCKQAKIAMLGDVSPLGQYAEFLNENGEIDLSQFPLSVYRIGSRLPKARELSVSEPWRNPFHYQRDNIASGSGNYYDNKGNVAQVSIYFNGVDTYTPSILSGTDAWLRANRANIEGVLEAGYYQVSPHHLASFEDFIRFWPADGSWAQSLLIYHPEYPSLQICENLSPSNSYDDRLLYSSSESPDFDINWYRNPVSIDPYFDSSQNPYLSSWEKLIFQNALAKYESKDSKELSIWQFAHVLTFCPTNEDVYDENGVCSRPCLSGFDKNLYTPTKEEWDNFKMIYRSLKQKLVAKRMIHQMILADSYNACMSDDEFSYWDNRFIYYQTNPNWTGQWGWWYFNREVFDYRQPCSVFNIRNFRSKTPRFVVNKNILDGGSAGGEVCYEVPKTDGDYLGAGDYEQNLEIVSCNEEDERVLEKMSEKGNAFYIDQCGQCPIANSMALLLSGVINKQGNSGLANTNALQLSCYPEGVGEFVPEIETALGLGKAVYNWQTVSAENVIINNQGLQYKQLTARIFTNGGRVDVVLRMSPDYEVADYGDHTKKLAVFDWSDIESLCCFSYLESGAELLTLTETNTYIGKTFGAGAFVTYTQSDGRTRSVRIHLEGYTSEVILNECDITVCETKTYAKKLVEALNMLAFSEASPVSGQSGVSSKLISSGLVIQEINEESDLTSLTANNGEVFEVLTNSGIINSIYNGTEVVDKWIYTGIINTDGTLVMSFTAFSGSLDLGTITFTLDLLGNDVTNIERFSYVDANKERDTQGVLLYNPEQVLTIHSLLNTTSIPEYLDLPFTSNIPLMECVDYGYGKNEQN